MNADSKDKHVLDAAAVHSRSDVLVTDNVKDFSPRARAGPHAMKEKTSKFLSRLLHERPAEVQAALQKMLDRNKFSPRTMPELIDNMAGQEHLGGFARDLNAAVPEGQRGSHGALSPAIVKQAVKAMGDRSPRSIALDGVAQAQGAATPPASTPTVQTRSPYEKIPGLKKGPQTER